MTTPGLVAQGPKFKPSTNKKKLSGNSILYLSIQFTLWLTSQQWCQNKAQSVFC
jgi:hypothetical protein